MPIPNPYFRGFMVNYKEGLFLNFMLNPQPITITKQVTWDTSEHPGLPAPIYTFQYSGQKSLTFDLFFDESSAAQSSNLILTPNPAGVLGIESILETFLYPSRKWANQAIYAPPPLIYLFVGLRFWKGFLTSAPFEETRFNKWLIPVQLKVTIDFTVIEDGLINDLNTNARMALAIGQSAANVFNYALAISQAR